MASLTQNRNNPALGAAIGSGVGSALGDIFQGKSVNSGMMILAMFASAGVQVGFSTFIEGNISTLYSGIGRTPGSLADKLTKIGLDADEIILDASLTTAATAGIGAATFLQNVFYTTVEAGEQVF